MTGDATHTQAEGLAGGVAHYENFPVASWLCPAALRQPVTAIYHFARTADDLADEGTWTATERLAALRRYRLALDHVVSGAAPDASAWPQVFQPLQVALRQHRLPVRLLHDLLDAFEQDVRHTDSRHRYACEDDLLDYCRLSANPVGRLLLHLYGISDTPALVQSDRICSALQLINFWQDLGVDLARGRDYLPTDLLEAHGLTPSHFSDGGWLRDTTLDPARQAVVAHLCGHAREMMGSGAPLVHRLPGRFGWELRLVVQGGLRILDKIGSSGHRSWLRRPSVGRADLPRMIWRALLM
ncbi:MAG: squalene synthase HpnC [Burkholderiaceae bacterium]